MGGASNQYYGGVIDEIRFWSVSRTSLKIKSAWNRVLNETELDSSKLIGYWRFDEGNGNVANDYSNQNNDAILAAEPYDPTWHYAGAPIIPEFPSLIILPIFMTATLLAVIVYKTKHTK